MAKKQDPQDSTERLRGAMADSAVRLSHSRHRAEVIAGCADRLHDRAAERIGELRQLIAAAKSDADREALEGEYLTLLAARARAAQVKGLAQRDVERLSGVA